MVLRNKLIGCVVLGAAVFLGPLSSHAQTVEELVREYRRFNSRGQWNTRLQIQNSIVALTAAPQEAVRDAAHRALREVVTPQLIQEYRWSNSPSQSNEQIAVMGRMQLLGGDAVAAAPSVQRSLNSPTAQERTVAQQTMRIIHTARVTGVVDAIDFLQNRFVLRTSRGSMELRVDNGTLGWAQLAQGVPVLVDYDVRSGYAFRVLIGLGGAGAGGPGPPLGSPSTNPPLPPAPRPDPNPNRRRSMGNLVPDNRGATGGSNVNRRRSMGNLLPDNRSGATPAPLGPEAFPPGPLGPGPSNTGQPQWAPNAAERLVPPPPIGCRLSLQYSDPFDRRTAVVVITEVFRDSLGERLGLKAGDRIIQVNNLPVRSREEYEQAAWSQGGRLVLVVQSGIDGSIRTVDCGGGQR